MKFFKKFFILSTVLLTSLALQAQKAPTLQEMIDSALASDGTLNQQILENQYTKLDQEKLVDIFKPKLEMSGKAGYLYANALFESPEIAIPAVKPVFPGIKIKEGQVNNLGVSGLSGAAKAEGSMLLYSGGKVKYLKEALREKNLSENILMDKSRDEVITEVSKAYDQLALIHESKRVLNTSKKRLEANKNTADKALGYGLITPYDHLKIELAQATLDSKMAEYEGKKELLLTLLQQLTGMERSRLELLEPELRTIAYDVVDPTMIENRTEIQALEHGIKASEFKMKAEKRWWVPKVQAQSSLSYMGLYSGHIKSNDELIPGTGKKIDIHPSNLNVLPVFQIGVGFKWDIFDGNEGKHAIEKARIDKEILENKRADAIKKLNVNLANNQTYYNNSIAQIKLKEKAKYIAEKGLQQIEKEFRYGTKTSSALVDAENDLENAELELQTAIFNQRRAAVELMKSTQNLDIDKL